MNGNDKKTIDVNSLVDTGTQPKTVDVNSLIDEPVKKKRHFRIPYPKISWGWWQIRF